MLQNADPGTLTVHQVAEHLDTNPGNITRELNLAAAGQPGRLAGKKVGGPGIRGRGGQWRIDRDVYLDWLGVPEEDRGHLDDFGLPRLVRVEEPWRADGKTREAIRLLARLPHVTFGRRRYLTHHQLERLKVLLAEDCRDKPR